MRNVCGFGIRGLGDMGLGVIFAVSSRPPAAFYDLTERKNHRPWAFMMCRIATSILNDEKTTMCFTSLIRNLRSIHILLAILELIEMQLYDRLWQYKLVHRAFQTYF